MVEGITLSKSEYYGAKGTASSIIGSEGYGLEKMIVQMGYTSSPNRVYNALLSFFTCVEATYQKYKQVLGEVESMLVGAYIGALEGKKILGVENAKVNGGFENVQLDFSSSHLDLLNNLAKIYRGRMEHRTLPSHIEFTSSFLEWNLINAVKSLNNNYHSLYESLLGKEAKVRDETYRLTFAVGGKRFTNAGDSTVDSEGFYNMLMNEREKFRRIKEHNYIVCPRESRQQLLELISSVRGRDKLAKRHDPTKMYSHIMVVGPPGTGKSTLIHGMAREAGDILFGCDSIADLVSTYFAGGAKAIAARFQAIYNEIKSKGAKGYFYVIEEIEAISGNRSGGGDKEQMTMMVSTLTTYLDAISYIPIIVFGITNRPEIVDPAIRSRMKPMYMGYPKTAEEELEIHKMVMKKMQDACLEGKIFTSSFDPAVLLRFSKLDERFKSGRVIDNLYRQASIRKDLIKFGEPLTPDDLVQAFEEYNHNLVLSDKEGETPSEIFTKTR